MKFGVFKEFRKDSSDIEDVVKYLKNELSNIIRELSVGIKKLSFKENFQSFTVDVIDLGPGEEVEIQNRLIDNTVRVIPSGYLITKSMAGRKADGSKEINNVPISIVVGDSEWTTEKLYLKNVGSKVSTFTVVFLR
jgi:hypothetical protein